MENKNIGLILFIVLLISAAAGGYFFYKKGFEGVSKPLFSTSSQSLPVPNVDTSGQSAVASNVSGVSGEKMAAITMEIDKLVLMQASLVDTIFKNSPTKGGMPIPAAGDELEKFIESDPNKTEKQKLAQSIATKMALFSKEQIITAITPLLDKVKKFSDPDAYKTGFGALLTFNGLLNELTVIGKTSKNPDLANIDTWAGQLLMETLSKPLMAVLENAPEEFHQAVKQQRTLKQQQVENVKKTEPKKLK